MDLFKDLRPSENATLWRFMDLFKFLDLITSNKLTLVNLTVMKDPFEGILHRDIEIQTIDVNGNTVNENDGSISKIINLATRQSMYISCWHENEYESAGMWDLYGNQKGIAIKTSVKDIKSAIKYDDYSEMDILKTNYYTGTGDYFIPERDTNHIYTGLVNKRISFEHEKEVRLIWHPRDYNNNSPLRKIDVNLKELINVIYVSPIFEDWQLNTIKRLVDQIGLDISVHKSELYELH